MVLLGFSLSASCTVYEVREDETGWTTGYRRSMTASFEISGFALGEGTYHRYTEMDVNDVRMSERISAKDGTLDTEEQINLRADDVNPWEEKSAKLPGSRQDYSFTVNETWPVSLTAKKSTDYVGRGISDREIFGNNLDYVSSQHLYSTDFRKDRTCELELKNAWFEAILNDTTDNILRDTFLPAKSTDYDLDTHSTGLVILKYGQAKDREVAGEGDERYEGSFRIHRHISMGSPGRNETDSEDDWLGCCAGNEDDLTASPSYECIFLGEVACSK